MGIYYQNGDLKETYKLSNMVSCREDEYELCIREDFISSVYFWFQDEKYKLRDIQSSLIEGAENEIFPGIYLRNIGNDNYFSSLVNSLLKKKKYLLRNENKRDFFQICSKWEETKSEFHAGKTISTKVEYINPQSIEQPGSLGGGECGGCPIRNYFNHLGLLDRHDINGYYFFSDEEVIEATQKEEFFLGICRHSNCYKNYEKILNEGFAENLETRYQIKVSYDNGKYIAVEGKHRVCAMKRFGYTNPVPMRVTRNSASTGNVQLDIQHFSDNKQVLDSCYSTYERIGISPEAVRELLKNPHATALDYLNRSQYSYEEISDHARW